MRRVLATDFGIWPVFKDLHNVSDNMLASTDHWSRLASYLLMYDQVVIPTGNFQVVPVLRLILGEDMFDEAIRSRAIVLARYDQWFGYIGNGGGLGFFQIHPGPNQTPDAPNMFSAFFQPVDHALRDILSVTTPQSSPERMAELRKLLIDNVVQLPTQTIANTLRDETYSDVLGSPYLRDFLSLRNRGRSLDALRGINPDQVTIYTPHIPTEPTTPEIRAVLRVAFENFLLFCGGHSEATEITGDDSTLSVLHAKGQRLGMATEGTLAFAQIQKVSGVPDLGDAFAARQLSPRQVFDLRQSKHAQALRDWFAAGAPHESADETVARYVESVGKPSLIESLPVKVLRFAATSGIGALEPVSGTVVGAIDAFMLSSWFPGRSPRLFLKQAKVVLANSPRIRPPVMHGRDRNAPCSCGSGKKYKKCCGKVA